MVAPVCRVGGERTDALVARPCGERLALVRLVPGVPHLARGRRRGKRDVERADVHVRTVAGRHRDGGGRDGGGRLARHGSRRRRAEEHVSGGAREELARHRVAHAHDTVLHVRPEVVRQRAVVRDGERIVLRVEALVGVWGRCGDVERRGGRARAIGGRDGAGDGHRLLLHTVDRQRVLVVVAVQQNLSALQLDVDAARRPVAGVAVAPRPLAATVDVGVDGETEPGRRAEHALLEGSDAFRLEVDGDRRVGRTGIVVGLDVLRAVRLDVVELLVVRHEEEAHVRRRERGGRQHDAARRGAGAGDAFGVAAVRPRGERRARVGRSPRHKHGAVGVGRRVGQRHVTRRGAGAVELLNCQRPRRERGKNSCRQ